MTEREIIRYLKENSNKGVAFGFMPEEVIAWCGFHSPTTAFRMFNGVWSEPLIIRNFDTSNIYCLANEYEPNPKVKGYYEEFDVNKNGFFHIMDGSDLVYYHWFNWQKFIEENFDKYNNFGGWLYNNKLWSTKVLMNAASELSGFATKDDQTIVPVCPTKIRFWRFAE